MTHQTHQKLKSKFPDHRLVKFISIKKECPLSLKECWVYSTLLWRYKGKPVTKARLSKWAGVDRTRTLPRILTHLCNCRLVVRDGKKFKAVEPPSDLIRWFGTHIVGYGANERLVPSYNWAVYIRSRDIIDNLVECADALGHHCAAKLARRFGVCGKTITAARKRLKATTQETPLEITTEVKTVVVEEMPISPIMPERVLPVAPIALAGCEEPPAPPSLKARHVAASHAQFHGIETGARKELEKLCEVLKGFSNKEIGQIISALVKKYGKGEGLEDAIWDLMRRRYIEYVCGSASYAKLMKDIGLGCRAGSYVEDDDYLSIFGDEEAESAWEFEEAL